MILNVIDVKLYQLYHSTPSKTDVDKSSFTSTLLTISKRKTTQWRFLSEQGKYGKG